MSIALFPGSFDPFTVGHEDMVRKALLLFDKVIIAIGVNTLKHSCFPIEERLRWIRICFADEPRVEVTSYEGLTVDFCHQKGVTHILRGLRNAADFQYESEVAEGNRLVDPQIETVFLLCNNRHVAVSSTVVRELWLHGHDISPLIPEAMRDAFPRH